MGQSFGFEVGGRTVEVQCNGTPADSGLHHFEHMRAKPIFGIFAYRKCSGCGIVPLE